MTFLAIDTSGEYAVLALAEEDGTVRAASVFEGKRTLSRRIMGALDSLLKSDGLALSDLSAFAVGLGPGSFTGVRVGVTTAKTLAQVTGKPLVGVGTLDAYAAVWQDADTRGGVAPVLPSRRGEVYAAHYGAGASAEGASHAPFAVSIEEMQKRLETWGEVLICGSPHLVPGWHGKAIAQPWVPPDGLARLAARRLAAGEVDDPMALVPLYVVAPSISTPKNPTVLPPESPQSGAA